MAYGFRPATHGGYNYETGGFEEFPINPAEGTRISNGDLVKLTDDYGIVRQAAVPVPGLLLATSVVPTQALGVFVGCRYVDSNNSQPTWNQYWPAAAGTEAFGFVVTDASAVFKIQLSTVWEETDLGNLVNPTLTAGTGNDGNSRGVVASGDNVAEGCLRIVGVIRDGSNENSSTPDILVRWSNPDCLTYGYQNAIA
jgi:hypothetical protein